MPNTAAEIAENEAGTSSADVVTVTPEKKVTAKATAISFLSKKVPDKIVNNRMAKINANYALPKVMKPHRAAR